jgi:hypothetical protein
VTDAFYEQVDDDRFRSTVHTTGPWDPRAQHAGGPSALLTGSMAAAVPNLQVTRVTLDILRPVPIADLTVSVEVVRPGGRISLVEGTLSDEQGPCLLARAWAMRTTQIDLVIAPPEAPLPSPAEAAEVPFFDLPSPVGWHTSMELRFIAGGAFQELGPAAAWGRPRIALVAGRDWTPLERVMVFADAGNGVSSSADVREWLFINTDLTVHLTRLPAGDWVGMDAHSVYDASGVGAAHTVLHDERGPIGHGAQSLFVAPQERGG